MFSGLSSKDLHCIASYEAQRSLQSRSLRDFIIPSMRCFLFSTSVENDGSHERPHSPLEGLGVTKKREIAHARGLESRFPL